MTQEEKDLLLQDICGRLPYGVIVQVNDGLKGTYNSQLVQVFCDRLSCSVSVRNPLRECICIDSVKPYLRPMPSMTEDELQRYHELCDIDEEVGVGSSIEIIAAHDTPKSLDYLNSIHVDYRGLIPKGIAISTEEFNPYKD